MGRDGQPLVLHRPTGPERGEHPGITVQTEEDRQMATKATHDGIYTLNGSRFRIKAGSPLPDGAEMDGVLPSLNDGDSTSTEIQVFDSDEFQALLAHRDSLQSELDALKAAQEPAPDDDDAKQPEEPVGDKRAQEPAPETKAQPAAPQNKAAKPAPEKK